MNILIYHNILWSKYKGGVFSALHSKVKLDSDRVEIVQIAETDLDRIGLSGIDLSYHKYPYRLLFNGAYANIPKVKLIFKLFFDVIKSDAEIILLPGFHEVEFWAMLIAAKINRKIVGVFCDSTANDKPRNFLKGFLKRIFFSQCDVFFGYGVRSREYLMAYGADSRKIYYRCQAAALPHDYDPDRSIIDRIKLVQSNNEPRFLYVGRLSSEKNLITLIHGFFRFLGVNGKAKLVIVGSGPEEKSLVDLVNSLGIGRSVDFLGSMDTDRLRSQYLHATAFVLPSASEPWGLVVNEALSYGCPVIVSDRCGCVPELVIDGDTGYSFSTYDENDLFEKMKKIVSDLDDPQAVGLRCLSRISTFTPEAAASQIINGCRITIENFK